jgi:anthranilate phosphoribosyltransferase
VSEVVEGAVRDRIVDPAELGIEPSDPARLAGGSPAENAAEIRQILAGDEHGPKRDAVLLNAAGGIAAAGHASDLREGLDVARETLDAGAAATRLDELAAFTREAS